MSRNPSFNRLVLGTLLTAALGSLSWAGVFPRESAESIGALVKQGNGALDVVVGTIVGRTHQPNADPEMKGTTVTVLEVQGSSLISKSSHLFRVWFLGASWDPAAGYGTSAEPAPLLTDVGKRVVLVIEKSSVNADWMIGGMNRIAQVVRSASGQEVAVSQSQGFFVDFNMSVRDLEGRIRTAAGLK